MSTENTFAAGTPLTVLAGSFQGSISEPDWSLLDVAAEHEDRVFERFITFDSSFLAQPVVHASLAGFDIDNAANARLSLSVANVHAHGFSIRLRTWLNSRMWSVEVSWLAIGARGSIIAPILP